MEKKPFLTEAMAQEIIQDVPTPFHVYDEKGIRENARRINKAFSWNKGFKEYFAVKALPNPVIDFNIILPFIYFKNIICSVFLIVNDLLTIYLQF